MLHDNLQKEFKYVLSVLEKIEQAKDSQGNYNHEALCCISDLVALAHAYSTMLLDKIEGRT